MRKRKILTLAVATVACMAFWASVKFTDSSKTLLIQSNIEAISESAYGNDPDLMMITKTCYKSLKEKDGEWAYSCEGGTSEITDNTDYGNHQSCGVIYPCHKCTNHTPKLFSGKGLCYQTPI